MSMLKQKLQEDLKQAMLAKDQNAVSTLRMTISAIGYYEIQKGGAGYEATDEDVLTVIQKDVKQHRDSIEQFRSGNRVDLAEKEEQELSVLENYLPEQMGEEEITQLVDAAIVSTGATSVQDMGKVMAALMTETKGKADGSVVSRIVREKLNL